MTEQSTEGQEPIQEPTTEPVDQEPTETPGGPEAPPTPTQDPENDQADEPDDPHAVKPVDQAGHPDAADVAGSYFGTTQTADAIAPMADQELAQPEHLAQTEEAQKGFHGETPTSDAERESMTLAGRRAAREKAEAKGTQEPGLDGRGDLPR